MRNLLTARTTSRWLSCCSYRLLEAPTWYQHQSHLAWSTLHKLRSYHLDIYSPSLHRAWSPKGTRVQSLTGLRLRAGIRGPLPVA